MSLIFINHLGQKTKFTENKFNKLSCEYFVSIISSHDKGTYLVIKTSKGEITVRSDIKNLNSDELRSELGAVLTTGSLPFCI